MSRAVPDLLRALEEDEFHYAIQGKLPQTEGLGIHAQPAER